MRRFGATSINTNTQETSTLGNDRFYLYMLVIEAARNERFMFGNGAQWYIVTDAGDKVVIDTDQCRIESVPNYQGDPSFAWDTVRTITAFLMQTCGAVHETTMPYNVARKKAAEYLRNGHLVHTNGAQWHFYVHGTVYCFDFSGSAEPGRVANVSQYDAHASWRYMECMGGNTYRAKATESMKKFFGIFS